MENVDFKRRMWYELTKPSHRVPYYRFGAFAHSRGCHMLRASFLSNPWVDDDHELSVASGWKPWATMEDHLWLPPDHPEYRRRYNDEELVFPTPVIEYDDESRLIDKYDDRGYYLDEPKWEIQAEKERLFDAGVSEKRFMFREQKRTGKTGFALGIFECDRADRHPRMEIGKDSESQRRVVRHDGMAWLRYKQWRGEDFLYSDYSLE